MPAPDLQTYAPIHAELVRAARAFVRLRSIGFGSFDDYDVALRDVFVHTERMWHKVAAAAKGAAKWPTLRSRWVRERRTDPLLVYAAHARNINEHDIAPIVKEWDAALRFDRPVNPTKFFFKPWSRDLQPVVDRGVTYNPPTSHLGRALSKEEQSPLGVTSLALKYYVDVHNVVIRDVYNVKHSGESQDLLKFASGLEKNKS
jgi:hypothetical protein